MAYFYWSGGPLPWLREQALVTFQRHHPRWRVVLGSPEFRDPPPGVELQIDDVTDPGLPPAARSDWWRWHVLIGGGIYADTDVLFTRSVEPLFLEDADAWLTTDGGHAVPRSKRGWRIEHGRKVWVGAALSIGVIGARVGSVLARRAADLAAGTQGSGDYQSHGTSMLVANWSRLTDGLTVGSLPFSAFYGGASAVDVSALWRPGSRPPDGATGVHWYGGSPESAPFLLARSAEDLPDCAVRRCLK